MTSPYKGNVDSHDISGIYNQPDRVIMSNQDWDIAPCVGPATLITCRISASFFPPSSVLIIHGDDEHTNVVRPAWTRNGQSTRWVHLMTSDYLCAQYLAHWQPTGTDPTMPTPDARGQPRQLPPNLGPNLLTRPQWRPNLDYLYSSSLRPIYNRLNYKRPHLYRGFINISASEISHIDGSRSVWGPINIISSAATLKPPSDRWEPALTWDSYTLHSVQLCQTNEKLFAYWQIFSAYTNNGREDSKTIWKYIKVSQLNWMYIYVMLDT